MKNADFQDLILKAVKGQLNQAQRREFDRLFQSDPAFRHACEVERALESALAELPDAPVSSNFTSLVLQAASTRSSGPVRRSFRFSLPRFASVLVFTLVLGFAVFQQNQKSRHREVAESVSAFHDIALALGSEEAPELLANFDAIQRLNIPAESELDLELLAALQK